MKVLNRKWWSRIAFGLIGAFLAIQLVPYGRAHSNPPVTGEPAWDSPATRQTFERACNDCHSHQTKWPWYSHVAPASWSLQRHVDKGRAEFNVSRWGTGENEGDEASENVRERVESAWLADMLSKLPESTW